MRTLLGYIVCLVALLLPNRLRVLLVDGLGWLWQGVRFMFKGIFEFLVRQLVKPEQAGHRPGEP